MNSSPENLVLPDQQPVKRIIGRKSGPLPDLTTPLVVSGERIEFSRRKTRSRIAPKGVFRYKSHAEANADMERWVSESIQRFETQKSASRNFHDLLVTNERKE